jgi:hypothetical protein
MAGIIAELFYPCTRECVASVTQRTAPAPTDDYGGGAQHQPPAIDPRAKGLTGNARTWYGPVRGTSLYRALPAPGHAYYPVEGRRSVRCG